MALSRVVVVIVIGPEYTVEELEGAVPSKV
jgi:hypothetical protein